MYLQMHLFKLKTYLNEVVCDFFSGDIADQIAKDVQSAGGSMTKKDLEDYQLHVKKPLNTTLKGLIMLSTPPPGGKLVYQVFNLFNLFHNFFQNLFMSFNKWFVEFSSEFVTAQSE